MDKLLMSVVDVCVTLSVGKTMAYDLMNRGLLEKVKIGRRTLVTAESVEALIERSKMGDV